MTEQLSHAQQEAATYEGGPLIVLAGPGTGKTRVITHRIAHMVRERGVSPEKVLAVTFSVKAAQQLRDRLEALIGPAAGSLNVHTFNGLGMRLLRRHAGALGLGPTQVLIDPAQASRLLQEIILKHGLFPEARGQGLASIAAMLLPRFEAFATHGASPEKCAAVLANWPEPAPGPDEDAEAQREQRRQFEQECRAYQAYTAERLGRGWLTYNDQLLLPIRLLRERPALAALYRADFAHVVVDEFQDCNAAQIELLSLFAGRPTHDICVVGDDDQSIYAFRGADEQAFTRFERVWHGPKVITLDENWRSAPAIVGVTGRIIARAGRRFRPDKSIASPPALRDRPGVVEAVGLGHDFDDADAIRDMLLTERAKAAARGETIIWKHFAIIARNHGDLARIAGSLTLAGIPIDLVREKTLLDDDGVKDVLAWAGWIVDPGVGVDSRRLMVRPPVLASLEAASQTEDRYKAARAETGSGLSFAAWLEQDLAAPEALRALAQRRADLARDCANLTGEQAIDLIVTRTDPAHTEMLGGHERARRVRALVGLVSLVRDKQPRLEAPGDLRALLDHLELLRSLGAMNALGGLGDVDGEQTDAVGQDEGHGRVQLLTAHASKGLEFDTVFVPRVTPANGYPFSRGETAEPLPPGLIEELDPRPTAERRQDEERRIFYVACTRAERRLVLLAKQNKSPSKTIHFFEQVLRDSPEVVRRAPEEVRQGALDAGLALPARWPIDPAQDEGAQVLVDRLRRAAREQAATALYAAESQPLTPELLAHASDQLAAAARRLALLGEISRTGQAPAWLEPGSEASDVMARMEAARRDGPPLIRPMASPLNLSYSALRAYERCPRCFYLERVLGLREPSRGAAEFGSIVHQVLHEFFEAWRSADAEGRPLPTADDAKALALRHDAGRRAGQAPPDAAMLDQMLAQIDAAVSRLHRPNDHILELERDVKFGYSLDGATHRFEAKIDRLDALPDGRRRIVDYKTGASSKALREPPKTDLQMAVYALALAHHDGTPEQTPSGVAEYWILSTGERGQIDLAALDLAKVRGKIDEIARKMLAGEFPCGKDCDGLCRSII